MSAASLDVGACEYLAELARTGRTDELVATLGSASADVVDIRDDSLLLLAAYHGHPQTVEALLALGADLTFRNARGLSPLDGAAFKGATSVIEALLAGGADVNESGPDGKTPLMWAAAFGRSEAVELLLARGADMGRADRSGSTAADHARAMGAYDVLPLLNTSLRPERREAFLGEP